MLDVCICTHRPRGDILEVAIRSIAGQLRNTEDANVLVIDNGSSPPLDVSILRPLQNSGIHARIAYESRVGLSNARYRAITETDGDWILFVDDDNELAPDYLSAGRQFILQYPNVGCFGGKLLLPAEIEKPEWILPFLRYLGIKDLGDRPIFSMSESWTECEPPGAGGWVRRDVAALYAQRLDKDLALRDLGRVGAEGVFTSDDSLMMRGAYYLGLYNAYCPMLSLTHHLAPHRFTFPYLLDLMSGYGWSQLQLEKALIGEHPLEYVYEDPAAFSSMLDEIYWNHNMSGRLKSAMMMWHISANIRHDNDIAERNNDIPLTLVTPCLNAAKTIERTLKSIKEQNYQKLQYIVCDGGSTDGTLDIINEYKDMIDVLIVGKDKNVADALNRGFAKATGEIRGYINADDCLAPGALRKVASIFANAPGTDVITGSCHRRFADGTDLIVKVPSRYLEAMSLRNDIDQPSTFWRREIQEKAGPFDDTFTLAFDWEYWNRLKSVGAKFHRTDKLLSIYYFTDDNLTSRGGTTAIEEMYRITKQYAGAEVADVYMFLFKEFDMNGFYDVPFQDLPFAQQKVFGAHLQRVKDTYGEQIVHNYNWNWACKQIRGIKWY
jgi:glycosyltransferase involved in cell wall biosynthesis